LDVNSTGAGVQTVLNLRNDADTLGVVGTAIHLGYASPAANYGTRIVNYGDPTARFAGDLVFERGGGTVYNESMRIDSSGNLGIGTSSPNGRLTLQNAATRAEFGETSGAIYIESLNTARTDSVPMRLYGQTFSVFTKPVAGSYSQNLTLDAPGNLGLGFTPSAWGSGWTALQVKGAALWTDGNTRSFLTTNLYFDGSSRRYISTNPAFQYTQDVNGHQWYTAPSGTAGDAISFTQAMTLDANGNLLVATTSAPAYGSKLRVEGGIETFANQFNVATTSSAQFEFVNRAAAGFDFYVNSGGTLAARIDSSGNLLVGTTSDLGGLGGKVQISSGASRGIVQSTNSNIRMQEYLVSGTTVGFISNDGTNTTYSTSSDYRLKNTIAPMTGALAKVALLKPCTYKWNADGSDGEGFIAHELAEVVPQCVTGEKDAVDAEGKPQYQGIDASFLVATLTAAIQELKAEFDAYKASHP
jgi:hypothetical protein